MYIHIIWTKQGGAQSTSDISSQVKEWNYKKGGDWFEPALNIHTPLSLSLTLFFFLYFSNDCATWCILIIQTNKMHYFSYLFSYRTLHDLDWFTVHHQESGTVYTAVAKCHNSYAACLLPRSGWKAKPLWQIPIAVYTVLDSWWWTVNLSELCRTLYQNKFEKWCIFLVFIIRISYLCCPFSIQ
jgi:hypothetical protein